MSKSDVVCSLRSQIFEFFYQHVKFRCSLQFWLFKFNSFKDCLLKFQCSLQFWSWNLVFLRLSLQISMQFVVSHYIYNNRFAQYIQILNVVCSFRSLTLIILKSMSKSDVVCSLRSCIYEFFYQHVKIRCSLQFWLSKFDILKTIFSKFNVVCSFGLGILFF